MNFFWSAIDKRDSKTITALRFSIAFTISFSDFVEVVQTLFQAVAILGAESFTSFGAFAFGAFDFVAILFIPFVRLVENSARVSATGLG
jgi:hypothetical protein